MRNRSAWTALPVLLALALPAAADAQVRIGFAGGPSFPMGDLADVASTGMHARGGVDFQFPLLPLGVRGDILWQSFPAEQTGRYSQLGGLLNATWRLPLPVIKPYLVAGAGQMRHDEPGDVDTVTSFAWAFGGGVELRIPGIGAFAEARYLDWGGGNRGVPLTIGITF